MEEKTTLGPLCTAGCFDLVQRQIKTAIDDGVQVLIGGERLDRTLELIKRLHQFFPIV
jgi:succinate-semialdehyde dehydrogenase/glutarate-semialdehyde dehydrogenase